MKVAITGDTRVAREELVARSVAAGLNMMTSVSGQTGVVVTNDPGGGSAKLSRAVDEGVPLVGEPTYLRLPESVRPGQAKGTAQRPRAREAAVSVPAAPAAKPSLLAQRTAVPTASAAPVDLPLAGRRVLVLGGTRDEAAEARARAVALGASAAVNLCAGVSDVVLLLGGETDRRMTRIATLGLRVHDADWLLAPTLVSAPAPPGAVGKQSETAAVLVRGAVIDLADTGTAWTVAATWRQQTVCDVDVVAFAVNAREQVPGDEDFAFYGAPEHPDGTVRLGTDGPTEQAVTADLERLPLDIHRVVIAAAIDGAATPAGQRAGGCVPSGRGTTTAWPSSLVATASTSPNDRCRPWSKGRAVVLRPLERASLRRAPHARSGPVPCSVRQGSVGPGVRGRRVCPC